MFACWLDLQLPVQSVPITTKAVNLGKYKYRPVGWFMVFNATFNNISPISWQSVLLGEET
jgi:hypothetical protein